MPLERSKLTALGADELQVLRLWFLGAAAFAGHVKRTEIGLYNYEPLFIVRR